MVCLKQKLKKHTKKNGSLVRASFFQPARITPELRTNISNFVALRPVSLIVQGYPRGSKHFIDPFTSNRRMATLLDNFSWHCRRCLSSHKGTPGEANISLAHSSLCSARRRRLRGSGRGVSRSRPRRTAACFQSRTIVRLSSIAWKVLLAFSLARVLSPPLRFLSCVASCPSREICVPHGGATNFAGNREGKCCPNIVLVQKTCLPRNNAEGKQKHALRQCFEVCSLVQFLVQQYNSVQYFRRLRSWNVPSFTGTYQPTPQLPT